MTILKKGGAILLFLSVLIALFGCGVQESASTTAATPTTTTEQSTKEETAVETTVEIATTPETTPATTAAVTTVPATEASASEPVVIKIVSMNTQNSGYDKSGEPTIGSKYQKLADAISEKNPDLILLQEVNTSEALEGIRSRLADQSKYGSVVEAGTTTMIIYNKETLTLTGQGKEVIGTAGDANDSAYDRQLVWAKFRHVQSAMPFIAVPVHVDYVTKACKAQINLIVDYLKENFPSIPHILGGDFNAEIGIVSATNLTVEKYKNVRTVAKEKVNGDEKTFPKNSSIIDFVWYKSGTVITASAKKYEVLMQTLPTDHRPIYAEIELTK